jgi:hypothetical protein
MLKNVRQVLEQLGIDPMRIKPRAGHDPLNDDRLVDIRLPGDDDYNAHWENPLDARDDRGRPVYLSAAQMHDEDVRARAERKEVLDRAMTRLRKLLSGPLVATVTHVQDLLEEVNDNLVDDDTIEACANLNRAGELLYNTMEALTAFNVFRQREGMPSEEAISLRESLLDFLQQMGADAAVKVFRVGDDGTITDDVTRVPMGEDLDDLFVDGPNGT